ncbi:POLLEN-EXPRESSED TRANSCRIPTION FACTOR 2 [Wolffia australiana]
MELCNRCGERGVVRDSAGAGGGFLVCTACGAEQPSANFTAQAFTAAGLPVGAFAPPDRALHRRFLADSQIAQLAAQLGLSPASSAHLKALVFAVTAGAPSSGLWFPVLVSACAVLAARSRRLPLPIAEAASAIARDPHELGAMLSRLRRFLPLPPVPQFDPFLHLRRTLDSFPAMADLDDDAASRVLRHGRFLLRCAVNWSLSAGRRPLPLVAAVAVVALELNGVAVSAEELAGFVFSCPATCRKRRTELLSALVRAARALLPWGEDVNLKNVLLHAPLLLKFMEKRSKNGAFELVRAPEEGGSEVALMADDDGEFEISGEGLKRVYQQGLEAFRAVDPCKEKEKSEKRRKMKGEMNLSLFCDSGDLDSSLDLSLEEILDLDLNLGYDPLPPSFVAGLEARRRRKEKIAMAKERIKGIVKRRESAQNSGVRGKKRQRLEFPEVDSEDCVVELLLLHGVSEEEIEEGYYNRLLDLHVFTPMDS